MAIQRPRTTQVLPKWCPSVILNAFFMPLFTNNGSDKKIPLDLLTFKTAFLMSLESAAHGSELVVLSRAHNNITFSSDYSGPRRVSIKLVPKFMPENALLNTIPDPISFQGIAHIFPRKPERLLCPVKVLGQYINRTQDVSWPSWLWLSVCPLQTWYSGLYISLPPMGVWGYPANVWSGPWRRKTFTD